MAEKRSSIQETREAQLRVNRGLCRLHEKFMEEVTRVRTDSAGNSISDLEKNGNTGIADALGLSRNFVGDFINKTGKELSLNKNLQVLAEYIDEGHLADDILNAAANLWRAYRRQLLWEDEETVNIFFDIFLAREALGKSITAKYFSERFGIYADVVYDMFITKSSAILFLRKPEVREAIRATIALFSVEGPRTPPLTRKRIRRRRGLEKNPVVDIPAKSARGTDHEMSPLYDDYINLHTKIASMPLYGMYSLKPSMQDAHITRDAGIPLTTHRQFLVRRYKNPVTLPACYEKLQVLYTTLVGRAQNQIASVEPPAVVVDVPVVQKEIPEVRVSTEAVVVPSLSKEFKSEKSLLLSGITCSFYETLIVARASIKPLVTRGYEHHITPLQIERVLSPLIDEIALALEACLDDGLKDGVRIFEQKVKTLRFDGLVPLYEDKAVLAHSLCDHVVFFCERLLYELTRILYLPDVMREQVIGSRKKELIELNRDIVLYSERYACRLSERIRDQKSLGVLVGKNNGEKR